MISMVWLENVFIVGADFMLEVGINLRVPTNISILDLFVFG